MVRAILIDLDGMVRRWPALEEPLEAAHELRERFLETRAKAAVTAWSASPGELDRDALAAHAPDARLVLVSNATSRLADDLEALGIVSYRLTDVAGLPDFLPVAMSGGARAHASGAHPT